MKRIKNFFTFGPKKNNNAIEPVTASTGQDIPIFNVSVYYLDDHSCVALIESLDKSKQDSVWDISLTLYSLDKLENQHVNVTNSNNNSCDTSSNNFKRIVITTEFKLEPIDKYNINEDPVLFDKQHSTNANINININHLNIHDHIRDNYGLSGIRTGVVISTYNRPEYIKTCFEYLSRITDDNILIIIIDDASTDPIAIQYINDFRANFEINNMNARNIQIVTIFKPRNMGIAHSLKSCWSALYDLGIEYIMNIDSDIIMQQNFISKLHSAYSSFANHNNQTKNFILTGYNSANHYRIRYKTDDYLVKESIGGANFFFHRDFYASLRDNISGFGWDWDIVGYMNTNNYPFVCTPKSVVQHIGFYGMNTDISKRLVDISFDFVYDYDTDYYLLPCIDSDAFDTIRINPSEISDYIKNNKDSIAAYNSNGYIKYDVKHPLNCPIVNNYQGTFIKKSFYHAKFG